MDYKEILELMKEMDRTSLTKLELENQGTKLCIEKNVSSLPTPIQLSGGNLKEGEQSYHQTISTQSIDINETSMSSQATLTKEQPLYQLTSPMVGTFYAAPSPEKPAFVKVGDKVKKGQTLCIIEAMKLMNEIESEVDGEVVEIFVKNEEMVPYGKVLMSIRED